MWNQYWIPFLIPTLITRSNGDGNRTDSDTVFIRSGGHAEAEYQRQTRTTTATPHFQAPSNGCQSPTKDCPKQRFNAFIEAHKGLGTLGMITHPQTYLDNQNQYCRATTTTVATTTTTVKIEDTTAHFYEEATDTVLFVPNKEPPVTRDENEYDGRGLRIHDIMMLKSVNDAMTKDFRVEKDGDKSKEDIVFITGKNHDFDHTEPVVKTRRRNDNTNYNYKGQIVEEDEVITVQPKLNCNDLDCDNTIQSVCGAKLINNEMQYRLFLNDCFFRKVNCAFNYEQNRYMQVDTDKCKKIGAHVEKRFYYKEKPYSYKPDPNLHNINARRSPSARRSRTMDIYGELCSHPCPVTCPEDYDPQCAMSESGQRRVFLNHCKLDLNSCSYHIGWHKRPLSECVGGKKADMRQNRGFIGWMQRVGIVDKKGRLVLE